MGQDSRKTRWASVLGTMGLSVPTAPTTHYHLSSPCVWHSGSGFWMEPCGPRPGSFCLSLPPPLPVMPGVIRQKRHQNCFFEASEECGVGKPERVLKFFPQLNWEKERKTEGQRPMYWDTVLQREFIGSYHTLFRPTTYVA